MYKVIDQYLMHYPKSTDAAVVECLATLYPKFEDEAYCKYPPKGNWNTDYPVTYILDDSECRWSPVQFEICAVWDSSEQICTVSIVENI